jgi:hypothetical protein
MVVHGDAHIDDLTLGYALMHEVWHAHQPTAVFRYNDMPGARGVVVLSATPACRTR